MGADKGTQARAGSPMGSREGWGRLAGLGQGRVQDGERQGTGVGTGHNHGHCDLPNREGHPRSQRGAGLKHFKQKICLQRAGGGGGDKKEREEKRSLANWCRNPEAILAPQTGSPEIFPNRSLQWPKKDSGLTSEGGGGRVGVGI